MLIGKGENFQFQDLQKKIFTPVKLHFLEGMAAVHLQWASRGPADVYSVDGPLMRHTARSPFPQRGGFAGWSSKHVVEGKVESENPLEIVSGLWTFMFCNA